MTTSSVTLAQTQGPVSWLDALRRVPLVAAIACLLSAGVVGASLAISPDVRGLVVGVALAGMVACGAVDLVSFRVPNPITYSGVVGLLIANVVLGGEVVQAVLGGAAGFGVMFLMVVVSRGAVGMGDAKLSAFGGVLVGLENLLPSMLAASLPAAVICGALLSLRRIRRDQPLPYGPFLSFGFTLGALAIGNSLWP
jgi:prepilin signal peptidase PulO-like enzyme (type II secretory pathway)